MLNRDELNRLAKWRQRLQRHFWSPTDEQIFLKITDQRDSLEKCIEEKYVEFAKKYGYPLGSDYLHISTIAIQFGGYLLGQNFWEEEND